MKGNVGEFKIDVNGPKRPNKFGRDIFWFYLRDNGIVYPYGSTATSEYKCSTEACRSIPYWKNAGIYGCVDKDSNGYCCAARVLEEGKMNY